MLKHLYIENYALIEKLDIGFSEGFSVITGETGAGKSILLGALSLILGQRADTQVLLDKNKKCIVEGSFLVKDLSLQELFSVNELDYDDTAVLRREINQQGKSRAFINDTPVNLSVMKDITEKLIDIHSQHQTLILADREFQIKIVDGYADNLQLVKDYKNDFLKYKQCLSKLEELSALENKSKTDLDYLNFQYDELYAAKLMPDEQETTEQELEILNHTEEIKLNLLKVLNILNESDHNIISDLSEINKSLNLISKYKTEIQSVNDRINSVYLELKDIAGELTNVEQQVIFNPERLTNLKTRLDLIYHLQQKHHVSTIKELIEIRDDIQQKINNISKYEELIVSLKNEITLVEKSLLVKSKKLSGSRLNVIPEIEKEITEIISKLGMPKASFFINLQPLQEFTASGTDEITFLFNANVGGEPKEIGKIASGGELSRLMLAVKSMISHKNLLPTIIFDEIDIGVSGDISNKVASIMKKMAGTMQVITITHIPQIAAKGDFHLYVYKTTDKTTTKSFIKTLKNDERIFEIAKMLSSDVPTEAATQNARELLKN